MQFSIRLADQSKLCNFGAAAEEAIRDQLVETCADRELQSALLSTEKLTLDVALQKFRVHELSHIQVAGLNSHGTPSEPVASVSRATASAQPSQPPPRHSHHNHHHVTAITTTTTSQPSQPPPRHSHHNHHHVTAITTTTTSQPSQPPPRQRDQHCPRCNYTWHSESDSRCPALSRTCSCLLSATAAAAAAAARSFMLARCAPRNTSACLFSFDSVQHFFFPLNSSFF